MMYMQQITTMGRELWHFKNPYIYFENQKIYMSYGYIFALQMHHAVGTVFDSEWRANASNKGREMMVGFHTMGEKILTALSRI